MQSRLKSFEWMLCLEYNNLFVYNYIVSSDTLVKLICAQRPQSLPRACFMTLLFCYVGNFTSIVIALITLMQSCHPRHDCFLIQHKCMCCTLNVFLRCIPMWSPLLGLPQTNLSSVPNPLSLEPFLQRTVW